LLLPISIVWFRRDLRLSDNPALRSALQHGQQIVPLYIHSPAEEGEWREGGAARWWLHQSLSALNDDLSALGAPLRFALGNAADILLALCSASGADAVFWNRRYEPHITQRDRALKARLRGAGLIAESSNGALLIEPWEIANQSGKPFQVFTPYWRQVLKQIDPAAPLPAPSRLGTVATAMVEGSPTGTATWPGLCALSDLGLMPRVRWYETMAQQWRAGEAGAQQQLELFADARLPGYRDARELPAVSGTSRLSPYLQLGAISPRQIWHFIGAAESRRGVAPAEWRTNKYLAELIWREFAYHLLFHFPHIPERPLRVDFERFNWREDAPALRAWQRGMTGVPLVDAGMRELWATGWMHNRVRMVVASFLVKNLRLRWQLGARWFWDTLIDADLANNTQGWQWAAGCGADAAPYFRIFNPVTQAAKFDPKGEYIRRWVPELAQAGSQVGSLAGGLAGGQYPQPIVDLKQSREEALAAFRQLRGRD
jgi:deoxyribodipyrimidine photo-lyase